MVHIWRVLTPSYNVDNDYPALVCRMVAGSAVVSIDLVSANTKLDARGLESVNVTANIPRSTLANRRHHRRLSHNFADLSSSGAPEKAASMNSMGGRQFDGRAPKETNTFAQVPVVGNLLAGRYTGRNTDGTAQENGYNYFAVSALPT